MTPEAQRIAIAEACPSVAVVESHTGVYWAGHPLLVFDPLNDLNAMHEAIMARRAQPLGQDFFAEFCEVLTDICGCTNEAIVCSAAQLAEAFLRTTGKWEDNK